MADTAAVYKNERLIRDCLARVCPHHEIAPQDVFITSKLGKDIISMIWDGLEGRGSVTGGGVEC